MYKPSQYTGVSYNNGRWQKENPRPWRAIMKTPINKFVGHFATEREAAIQYDKWVIENRLDKPLNILKPKMA